MTSKEALEGIKQSNIYYDELMFLYDEAIKGMNGYPSDNIEFAFETLEKALKELERLKKFKETFDNYELAKKQDFIAYENWLECEAELKKTPTVEEVCKALEKEYGRKFYYLEGEKTFCTFYEGGKTAFNGGNGKTIGGDVLNGATLGMFKLGEKVKTNPHLITMIGKFYESLEKEKTNE